ncbi:hypothetical protein OROMI_018672 [Orobanche minor]
MICILYENNSPLFPLMFRACSSNPAKLRLNASASANINDLASLSTPAASAQFRRESSWCFDDKLLIQTLYKVLARVSKVGPIILDIKDVEKLLCRSQRIYVMFQKMLKKLSGSILILGSRNTYPENDYILVDEKISIKVRVVNEELCNLFNLMTNLRFPM